MIRLEHVSKSYSAEVTAVRDASFDIAKAEFVFLVGPSGSGKTTVGRCVLNLLKPTSGTVRFKGAPIASPAPERGVVFQEPALFPWLSVLDNVTFGPRMQGAPAPDYLPRAERILSQVGL